MNRIDLNRIYWASNPEMLFELHAFKKRNIIANSFGKQDLSVHFTNEDGSKGQICSPQDLKPLLKNLAIISDPEVRELLDSCGYASATIKSVKKFRSGGGLIEIIFSVDEYIYAIMIEGCKIFSASQAAYKEETEENIEFQWHKAIDFLRSKGYNLDFKEGEFVDITPEIEAY